jgi:hypothetical protein
MQLVVPNNPIRKIPICMPVGRGAPTAINQPLRIKKGETAVRRTEIPNSITGRGRFMTNASRAPAIMPINMEMMKLTRLTCENMIPPIKLSQPVGKVNLRISNLISKQNQMDSTKPAGI